VRTAFTPRRVAELEGRISDLIDDLLAPLLDAGRFEVRESLAGPLPALVIAELLGVPQSHRADFTRWSDDLGEIVFSIRPKTVDPGPVTAATEQFIAFFGELIERERRTPGDSLLAALVHGTGGELSEIELVGACTLLLFAGHETTTNLLTTSVGHLAAHPDDQARLRGDAGLDATAVDEFVRTMGPAATMVRKVREPHERAGQALEPGQTVYLSIAAANHDPAAFDDPGRLDLGRDPNPHLGFGWGLHHCLGAALARLETRLALRRLMARCSIIEPDGEPAPLRGDVMGRARTSVPVIVR
jgi:cytochrome P450